MSAMDNVAYEELIPISPFCVQVPPRFFALQQLLPFP